MYPALGVQIPGSTRFVVCLEHQRDVERFQRVLIQRLSTFQLELEPTKTRLIAFGRFAARDSQKQGRKKPDTLYFLGFTHYSLLHAQSEGPRFKVGRRTEKGRLRRTLQKLQAIRHDPLDAQAARINQLLQGHYAYFGLAGNLPNLHRVYRAITRHGQRMLSSRSQKSYVTREAFQRILARCPLKRPKLHLSYAHLHRYAIL